MDRHGIGAVFRVIPAEILTAEQLGLSPHVLDLCHSEEGPGARHRSDRLGQVDDALRDDRPHQQDPRRSHHHDRRPDRVRAPQPEVPGQPARSAHAHALVQGRAARGAARGPGRHPRRRAARPRDDRHRDRDGRDGPPRVRHAAHDDRGVDGRPRHRSVPGRPPVADPRHAVGIAARRHRADALQEDRRRPRRGARNPDRPTARSAT